MAKPATTTITVEGAEARVLRKALHQLGVATQKDTGLLKPDEWSACGSIVRKVNAAEERLKK